MAEILFQKIRKKFALQWNPNNQNSLNFYIICS